MLRVLRSSRKLWDLGTFDYEYAGDWIEAIGGCLFPQNVLMESVLVDARKDTGQVENPDSFMEERRLLSVLARECKRLLYHVGTETELRAFGAWKGECV